MSKLTAAPTTSASASAAAGPSSLPLVTSAPPRASRRDLDQRQPPDAEDDTEDEEEEGEVAYRLLELPDEVCRLIEEAQLKERERREGHLREEEQEHGGEGKGTGRKRRRVGTDREREREREHLVINGRHGDEAVLCTADKTYALREITQSNSLLLCSLVAPHTSTTESDRVVKTDREMEKGPRLCLKSNVSQMLELIPVVPRLERIVELLQGSVYEGEAEEKRKKGQRRYTPQEVRSVVQASDAEVQRGYDEHHVVLLDGQMRLLSPAYLHSLLLSLLLILDSNAYLPDDVPLQDAMNALREDHHVREEVAEAILCRWFGQRKQSGSKTGTGSEPVATEATTAIRVVLDGTKLARFIGEQLLREASQPMLLSTLLSTWSAQLGDSFASCVSLSLLDSLYLLHPAPPLPSNSNSSAHVGVQRRIEHFPRSALPAAPAPRFQALFTARPSWTLQDLSPFIEDLAVDAKRREALLLRFARANKVEVPASVGAHAHAAKGEQKGKKGAGQKQKEFVTLYSARVRY